MRVSRLRQKESDSVPRVAMRTLLMVRMFWSVSLFITRMITQYTQSSGELTSMIDKFIRIIQRFILFQCLQCDWLQNRFGS